MSARRGILLVNLGTPDAPDAPAVRRYLREFLSDPRVIDVPALARWLLLELVILPFRPRKSAAAYRKVWTERGSPLLVHGLDLAAALRERLGPTVPVELGMRYQRPSIAAALERLRAAGADRITLVPLFPHYSSSAWGSAVEETWRVAGALWNVPAIDVVPPFYEEPGFVEACAEVARPAALDPRTERVILSFHGLPERQVRKSDSTGGAHCLASERCCDAIVEANRYCYRAQCYATARAIAGALGLAPDRWEVAFQSRLGRTPWIRPYTDVRLTELAAAGVKRIAVLCPAFVADCLETVEEIGIRGRDAFRAAGGEELLLAPCVNAHPRWADALAAMLRAR